AGGLTGQWAGTPEPLISQRAAGGTHSKTGSGALTGCDVAGRTGNNQVLIYRQTGAIGGAVSTGTIHRDQVDSSVRGTHICEEEDAVGLTEEEVIVLVPLVSQAGASRLDREGCGGTWAICEVVQ